MSKRLREIWVDVTVADRFVLVVAGLLPVAWAPIFLADAAPRVALALSLTPLGLWSLWRGLSRRDVASVLGATLIASGGVSTLLSPAPVNSIFSNLEMWSGWLALVAGVSWWAAGRTLTPTAAGALVPITTIGAVWNVGLAMLQVLFDVDSGDLASVSGRAGGTFGNPVQLGTLLSGVLAAWVLRRDQRVGPPVIVVFVLALGIGLNGGRAPVALAAGVGVVALLIHRNWRVGLANLAAIGTGIAGATRLVAWRVDETSTESPIATAGMRYRWDIWRFAADAALERPFFGWGPGNIELAIERKFDLTYTQRYLTENDTLSRWVDTHNIVVNLFLTLGSIGGVLGIGFIVAAVRASRPVLRAGALPLLGAAAGMAANWMLQPTTVHTFPLALLFVGAAAVAGSRRGMASDPEPDLSGPFRSVSAGPTRTLAGAGIVVAVALLANLLAIDRSLSTGQYGAAEALVRYGYPDALLLDEISYARQYASLYRPDSESQLRQATVFTSLELSRYPSHYSYTRVGEVAYALGDIEAALAAEQAALEIQPYNPVTNGRLLVLARLRGDEQLFEASMDVLCDIGASRCDPTATVDDRPPGPSLAGTDVGISSD